MVNKEFDSYDAFFGYIARYLKQINPDNNEWHKKYGLSDEEAGLHKALEKHLCEIASLSTKYLFYISIYFNITDNIICLYFVVF